MRNDCLIKQPVPDEVSPHPIPTPRKKVSNLYIGQIKLLWRISLGHFSSKNTMASYYRFTYGIDGWKALDYLVELGYVLYNEGSATLHLLTVKQLKNILKAYHLHVSGIKPVLITRIKTEINEKQIILSNPIKDYYLSSLGEQIFHQNEDWLWATEMYFKYYDTYMHVFTPEENIMILNTQGSRSLAESYIIKGKIRDCEKYLQLKVLGSTYHKLFKLNKDVQTQVALNAIIMSLMLLTSSLGNAGWIDRDGKVVNRNEVHLLPSNVPWPALHELIKFINTNNIRFLDIDLVVHQCWQKYAEYFTQSNLKYPKQFYELSGINKYIDAR